MKMTRHEYLQNFIRKHDCDYRVETGSLEGTTYHKQWLFEDGGAIYEVNDVIYEHPVVEIELHGVKVRKEILVRFNRCEMWNTDNANSVYFYERG